MCSRGLYVLRRLYVLAPSLPVWRFDVFDAGSVPAEMSAEDHRDALMWLASPHKFAPPLWVSSFLSALDRVPVVGREV